MERGRWHCRRCPRSRSAPSYSPQAVENAAKVLRGGEQTLLLLTGSALTEQGLALAAQIAGKTGCKVMGQTYNPRMARGRGPFLDRPHSLRDRAGAADPEGFPAHRSGRSQRSRGVLRLSEQAEPAEARGLRGASHDLGRREFGRRAGGAGRPRSAPSRPTPSRKPMVEMAKPTGALTHASIAQAIAMAIPENAIVVDEFITTGRGFFPPTAAAAPHDWLQNMGGSIGFSTPVATGAAVACPDRKVICMVGDGSAMYTLQSLWTQAREGLNVADDRVRQPHLSDPARRIRRRRRRRAGPARAWTC